ncbi:MAG: malate dehydrogenase (quinone) [Gordonia sp.]|uniref:malate dehydrogenase (quinone) n=2 Tax=Gordonia TaxID=2053 RepID=UPI001D4E480E|nr:malate dehydrogenase (quinone) [Gordonia sp. (in: high G+C Gram-positive bacteria)]MCB1296134.1 malate dehydrogenase (quinone) [Gordonia sp. (in: high G+C Gram-positive bacteria)]HMS75959.1 malate dehydrogenase (quinone) [Gordonia sp. (in: high G+C Gram-positive bacteria)]
MSQTVIKTDVALIGAGIMSATLGALIRRLEPTWSVSVFERLDAAAAESSDPWNNAGTGHSALCELNYTPQTADGDVDISKALSINEQFQVSRQFWAHAVDNGFLGNPKEFINPIPHVSFTHGADGVEYLRKRHAKLSAQTLFEGMEYITDPGEFSDRLPLMAAGRDFSDPVALNWFTDGTDVDFGALTQQLLNYVGQAGDVYFGHDVTNLTKQSDGSWRAKVTNRRTGEKLTIAAKFVFVGAGGGALHLLQKSGIAEAKGFGGFPVSGAFLRCTNSDLIEQHAAKVYGQAAVGAPPMSVPHLDTRVINHKQGLLFGPYAGWSPKFLKNGKYTDLPFSVKPNNIIPLLSVGVKEMALTKYLLGELAASRAAQIATLADFMPRADGGDWEMITAGQRVQVIRKTGGGGSLEFGTAVIAADDGTIAGLLGASPGASTAVPAMLSVLEQCFPQQYKAWTPKLTEMIPSFGKKLSDNRDLFRQVWDWTSSSLRLTGGHSA